jgi:hypothetical protein
MDNVSKKIREQVYFKIQNLALSQVRQKNNDDVRSQVYEELYEHIRTQTHDQLFRRMKENSKPYFGTIWKI